MCSGAAPSLSTGFVSDLTSTLLAASSITIALPEFGCRKDSMTSFQPAGIKAQRGMGLFVTMR